MRDTSKDADEIRRRWVDVNDDGLTESSEAVFEAALPLPPEQRRTAGLVRSGAIIAVAVALSNLLNVVFQLAMARLLPPPEYSLLLAMFSVVLVANVPILALQAKVAREVVHALASGGKAAGGAILIESLRPMARWGGILFGLGAVAVIPFAIIFNVDRELPAIAVATAVLAALPMPIAAGGLQACEHFGLLAGVQVAYGALKVLAGVALGALGFGAAAIVFGVALSSLAVALLALVPLLAMLRAGRGLARRERRLLDRYTAGAAITFMLITALTNLDLIASRVFLSPDQAGEFAAVGVAARSMLLLPIITTTVLFPRVAALRDLTAERSHLLAGLGVVGGLGLIALIPFALIPRDLLEIAFGAEYVSGADWMLPLGFAMLLYALVEVYMFHFLAVGRIRYAILLGTALALQVAMIAVLHSTAEQIILVQVIVAGVTLVASELYDRKARR